MTRDQNDDMSEFPMFNSRASFGSSKQRLAESVAQTASLCHGPPTMAGEGGTGRVNRFAS